MLRYNPEYGARPLKRVVQSELETPLAAPSQPPKTAKKPAAAKQAKINQKKKDKEPAMKSAAAVHAAPTKEAELVMVQACDSAQCTPLGSGPRSENG